MVLYSLIQYFGDLQNAVTTNNDTHVMLVAEVGTSTRLEVGASVTE